jgi:osmotically-inducible protein OsmY
MLCLLGTGLVLGGCGAVGLAAGAGASVGMAASQEGGLPQAAEDLRIRTDILDLWFRQDVEMFRKIDLTVREGRVMLTGVVQKPEHRIDAVRLAWQPKGVRQVINEITIADSAGVTGFAKDALISSKLRAKLTFDRDIAALNYTFDTVNGTIYLMGVARQQQELDRVLAHARGIAQVQNVVSYVRIRGESLPVSRPDDNTY